MDQTLPKKFWYFKYNFVLHHFDISLKLHYFAVPLKEGQWTVVDDSFEKVFDNEFGDQAAILMVLGKVLNKMSIETIFGLKHFKHRCW